MNNPFFDLLVDFAWHIGALIFIFPLSPLYASLAYQLHSNNNNTHDTTDNIFSAFILSPFSPALVYSKAKATRRQIASRRC